MSLDKAIESGKERRQPYRRSKAFDRTCRNHGSCPWCERQRTFTNKKREKLAELEIKETLQDDTE